MGQCVRKEAQRDNILPTKSAKKKRCSPSKAAGKSKTKSKRNSGNSSSSNISVAESLPVNQIVTLTSSLDRSAKVVEDAATIGRNMQPETYHLGNSAGNITRVERSNTAPGKMVRMNTSGTLSNVDSAITSPLGSDFSKNGSPDSPVIRKSSPMRRMFASPKVPRVLFKSPLPKHLTASFRAKNNSTSSLYITDTINSPNVDEIIRCMSVALLYHIKNGLMHPERHIERVFSEKYHPLTRELLDLVNCPDVATIYRYVNMIFHVQKLPPECAILCLAYIERILSSNRTVLHPENWRRIVFGSILIATKVWEDESVWNVDFLDVFPCLTLIELNHLENKFMELLQFNVLIIGSEYAKYYFELRALSQQESFPLEPLNKETQARLEERGQKTNEKMSKSNYSRVIFRDVAVKRARSVDFFDPKSPPAVLA